MDAFINLGVVFGIYQAIGYFNLAIPENVPYIRVLYGCSLLVQLLTYYYINARIKAAADNTVLKYVEAKKPFSDETEDQMVTTTLQEYDIGQVGTAVVQVCMSGLIVGFIHYNWGYIPPLVMQSFMGIKNLVSVPLVRIYIRGQKAEGDLARPFKAKTMFDAPVTPAGPKEIKHKEKKAAKKKAVGKVE